MVQDTTYRRVPIAEAAQLLGLGEHAVRKRVQRGTLTAEKDDAGKWLVLLHEMDIAATIVESSKTMSETVSQSTESVSETVSQTHETFGVDTSETVQVVLLRELVTTLKDEVGYLRSELEVRTEELRRKDYIIADLAKRTPELPAPQAAPPSPTHGSDSLLDTKRSWWQFWKPEGS